MDSKLPLLINGEKIEGFTNLTSLVNAIQAKSSLTGVTARLDDRGHLILSNLPARGGKSIVIGTTNAKDFPVTALGLAPTERMGRVRLKQALNESKPEESGINITFGEKGSPYELTQLGIRTGAYFNGQVPDDMLVFVTGVGDKATNRLTPAATCVRSPCS